MESKVETRLAGEAGKKYTTKGATFVSLEASMILQYLTKNSKIRVLLDHREIQPVSLTSFK